MRYFFHLCDGDFRAPDDTGNEFDSLELAELAALKVIDNLRATDPVWFAELGSPYFEIADSSGTVLSSLPFPPAERSLN
jgi:hypothetical protein